MSATNTLRIQGTENLIRASIAAGGQRIVGESMIFAYGFGDHSDRAKVERDPFTIPKEIIQFFMPYVAAFSSARLIVSNEKAKHDLLWQPSFPSYQEGLQSIMRSQ